MTRHLDNDEWLKGIGAVTVHDDDDRDNFAADSGSRSTPAVADDDVQPDPTDLASEDAAARFDDEGDGEESSPNYAEDDYDYNDAGRDALLGSPFDVGGSVVDLDSGPSNADARSQDAPPRRFTPW